MKVKGILIVYLILCNSIISCKETEINTKKEKKRWKFWKIIWFDFINKWFSSRDYSFNGFIGISTLSSYMCNQRSKCLISFGNDFFKWESEEKEK